MVGGGVYGKADGIALIIMTMVGVIMIECRFFTLTWIRIGEDIIETTIGMVTPGISNGYLTAILTGTGEDGIKISIGKNTKPGVSVITSLDHSHK